MLTFLILVAGGFFLVENYGAELAAPEQPRQSFMQQSGSYAPYIGAADEDLRVLWKDPDWQPQQWDQSTYHTDAVLTRIQRADIITSSYFDQSLFSRAVPIVEVGPNFYHLSNQDKTNVISYFNQAYDITNVYGGFYLRDWRSGYIIGEFGPSGLFLN